MVNDNKYENDIKELCEHMIHLLDKLKQRGLIDEQEYESLTYQKKRFLDSRSNKLEMKIQN
ncbi:hypothetical protein [Clostridium akagii]|uniref:hypothetical protein n=1 Tax=Clostridium akagii TaxID=91623 RepID=UPI00047D45F4|nr:hypothetical protein [Clostridium akagii]